jgi:hypothetical protein
MRNPLGKSAKIIDIGGDSKLVDYLLKKDMKTSLFWTFRQSIRKSKVRLEKNKVHWIVSDINDFKPDSSYDIWHDCRAFHFF